MSAAVARVLRRADAALDAVGVVRALSVLRIALGPLVVLHLEDEIGGALDGVDWSSRYHLPYFDWYPEPSPGLYEVALAVCVLTALAMSAGVLTRWTSAATTAFVGWNLFLSKTHFAHNRAFLLILLLLVTVVPTGRHLSVDAWWARRHGRDPAPVPVPLWPLWLARFEVCVVYLASAVSKTVDGDWLSGRVLQLRAIDNRALAESQGAPGWVLDVLSDATFQWWFSKGAIATEFVIALGFLHRRTRLVAVWVAVPFHLAIEVTARVQVFSWAALAALTLWVTPARRDRVLHVGPEHATFARLVGRLDWFGRFFIVDAPAGLRLDDRHGRVRHDTDARLTVLSRLPLTFWPVAPLLVWHRRRIARPPRVSATVGSR